MFKFDKGLSLPIMDNIFNFETENLSQVFQSVYHRSDTVSYLGTKIWDGLPEKLRNLENIETFTEEIKTCMQVV